MAGSFSILSIRSESPESYTRALNLGCPKTCAGEQLEGGKEKVLGIRAPTVDRLRSDQCRRAAFRFVAHQ